MHIHARKALSRRHMLRGLGVAVGLPFLEIMQPRTFGRPSTYKPVEKSIRAHPRLIFCYVPNGVNIRQWLPAETGAGYTLSPTLGGLKEHQQDLTVISGLGHPHSKGGHSGADTWLTGADLGAVPGKDYTNTISVDQVAADVLGKETRFSSLQLSDQSGTGSAGHSHTLSFDHNGTPLPAENSPQRLFERLFAAETADSREATLRRYAEKKSILDSVRDDAKRLQKKLGKTDQQKLEQYFDSVRQTEQRVERLESWVDVPKPEINPEGLQLGSQPNNGHDRPMWIDVMLELSYLSFVTDTTRVITYEWSREAGGRGGGGENHHELSHHGGDPGMLKSLAKIDRFHVARLKRFLDFLKQTEDGEGRMLDHTVVMFGSGMNSGEGGGHSPKNLPLLLAGGKQLGFRHGQHLAFDPDNHPPLSNLFVSLLQGVEVETDSFQDASGTLTGISVG